MTVQPNPPSSRAGRYRLGIDIGGTFTDLVLLHQDSGQFDVIKLSSTPRDPSEGFMQSVDRQLRDGDANPADCAYIAHATTVATNTVIEGRGARTGLLVTAGFRDILEIARQIRSELYNLQCDKLQPIVQRRHSLEVPERIGPDGEVIQPLDEAAVVEACRKLAAEQVESVVVCLLHAYINPAHERRVGELVQQHLPGVFLTLSSDICPEMREYFRASTAAINATVMPIMTRYVHRLEQGLSERGFACHLNLTTSSGGVISSEEARAKPVHLIESGPAAGVMAAAYFGGLAGFSQVISFDMGGTTAKLGLIEGGRPRIAPYFEVGAFASSSNRGAGYPIRSPAIDLVEIGAGGGSLGWIDAGGALRVGPRSAGADPGPAAYGLGQSEPTITDANLVLGRLNPAYFVGGERSLDPALAASAVSRIAEPLGLSLHAAASGILAIANARMVAAARAVSVQRGFDPREFTFVVFGGCGPLHACAIAADLNIARVLIPTRPGVASALGLLVSDIRHEFVQGRLMATRDVDLDQVADIYQRFESRARDVLTREHVDPSDTQLQRQLDMRFQGQSHELTIDLTIDSPLDRDGWIRMAEEGLFHAHDRAYGFVDRTQPTEIVNLRLVAVGRIPPPAVLEQDPGPAEASAAIKARRPIYFDGPGLVDSCPVYDRSRLRCGHRFEGPAVVEEYDSTTVVLPGFGAQVNRFGHLILECVK